MFNDIFEYKEKYNIPFNRELNNNDWKRISSRSDLTEKFIRRYFDCLDMYQVFINNDLGSSFIREFKYTINWVLFSANFQLSEEVIERYSAYVDWYSISLCQRLSITFILDNIKRLNLHALYDNPRINNELLDRHELKMLEKMM